MDYGLSTTDSRLSPVDCSSHRGHVRQQAECSNGLGVPSRRQVHSFVHASSQMGHGANSVGVHHLQVRGKCGVSIMLAPCAMAMPATHRLLAGGSALDALEISHDCEIFQAGRANPHEFYAERVAPELLIASADGAS